MISKVCTYCGRRRQLTSFNKNTRAKDGRQTYCKDCANKLARENYQQNKTRYFQHAAKRDARRDDLLNTAKSVPCADCGVQYAPHIMDFDHLDPELKVANVSQLRRERVAFSTLLAEIAKCEVVCSNCHRERTYQRQLFGTPSTSRPSCR